jgi:hypothetical protein
MPLARRSFFAGFMGVVVLAGIAALEVPQFFPGLFQRRYPPTPFDDLLALLPDRENAVRLGAALTNGRSPANAKEFAMQLRKKIGGHSLARAMADDLAQNRLTETGGWLLPESLAELCALAAMAEPS